MSAPVIDIRRLTARLAALGRLGRDAEGRLVRLAASDADKLGRDQLVAWLEEDGLEVRIDGIGNIFGLWAPDGLAAIRPVMIGSHIDTVVDAGIYDGSYGVLAGLEVLSALRAARFEPRRPLCVAAFTNEEGVRYTPDMMGSLVFAGGLGLEQALSSVGIDGSVLGRELERIGYAGGASPQMPAAYIELHIEQGPVLEREGISIGAVENLQGISWRRVTLEGVANHAGATPMAMRIDAGVAAAEIIVELNRLARASGSVATVGSLSFAPNVINVIPAQAVFTVDLRNPDETRLRGLEAALARLLDDLAVRTGVGVSVERLARFEPVTFDEGLVKRIEAAAAGRRHSCRRMTSGAGHDAQMIARLAPSAMIFVASAGGISHNPREFTGDADLAAGADVLLDVVAGLAGEAP